MMEMVTIHGMTFVLYRATRTQDVLLRTLSKDQGCDSVNLVPGKNSDLRESR